MNKLLALPVMVQRHSKENGFTDGRSETAVVYSPSN